MSNRRGILITLEGGEGSGKSTQIFKMSAVLELMGVGHICLREPGGTAVGEAVRAILLDPEMRGMVSRAELFLFEAARAQLVAEVIEPALEDGQVVIVDRFYDSSTSYQGYARGMDKDNINALNKFATGMLEPDLTIVIDVEPGLGLMRATGQGADRLESESLDFHRRVGEGFLAIAALEPDRVKVVDGSGTIEEIHEAIMAIVLPIIKKWLEGGEDGRPIAQSHA